MKMQTGRKTTISISERTYTGCDVPPTKRRSERIIIHDGWEWHIGCVHNESELEDLLKFLEMELTTIDHEFELETVGKVIYYNLSKNINNTHDGGFWTLEQLEEMSEGEILKKFKGLSNGSIVDCYIGIGKDVINIYRPNSNAKEVYIPFATIEDEVEYRRTHWYL